MVMRTERKSLAELWLRDCRISRTELQKSCQVAKETLTSPQEDCEEKRGQDKRPTKISTSLYVLEKVSQLCAWKNLFDGSASGDDGVGSVEAIDLPALYAWNKRLHTLGRFIAGQKWGDLRPLDEKRKALGALERSIMTMTTSVDSLLRHLDSWVRVIDVQNCTSELSQDVLPFTTGTAPSLSNMPGNVNFKQLLSPHESRAFSISAFTGHSAGLGAKAGSSLALVAVLTKPTGLYNKPAYESLEYMKMRLEPRSMTQR
jgi:hypothetical protein